MDGYIGSTFTPQGAQAHLSALLNTDIRYFPVVYSSQDGSYGYTDRSGRRRILDYQVAGGTVVPQTIWEPMQRGDKIRHVQGLQQAIFFLQQTGIGIPLPHAAGGYTDGIYYANHPAALGERTTTHFALNVRCSCPVTGLV